MFCYWYIWIWITVHIELVIWLHLLRVVEHRKEYFEIPWASLRGLVEPTFAERIVINHREYFKKGNLVVSSAVNITETAVVTEDGQQIAYDYLVIATGHTEPIPKTRSERLDQYKGGKTLSWSKANKEISKFKLMEYQSLLIFHDSWFIYCEFKMISLCRFEYNSSRLDYKE